MGSYCLIGIEFLFGMIVLEIEVMVVQYCECA
jgi:hypothetical protein